MQGNTYPPQQPYGQPGQIPAYPPGQQPMQVLPYQGPQMGPVGMAGFGAWKDGDVIACTRTVSLPPVCVKCGQPGGHRLRQTYYWHEPWVYLLILVSPIVYIIVAAILRKNATVDLALCDHHASRRRTFLWVFWSLCIGGLLLFVSGIMMASSGRRNEDVGLAMILLGILSSIIFAIVALISARTLKPTRIDQHYAWLKGAHAGLLGILPKANPWS